MRELLSKVSAFVDAGGVLLWSDWKEMSTRERAAFVAVKQRRRVEDAVRSGMATQGQVGMLNVAAELDGGQALEAHLLREAVTHAAI